ncbi:hypothetical protein IFT73_00110 [Aeromicrobium sp. CFBP 8757]|uniref:hypothetical protein n=1 Tax=Aeromicrobium sp. CFBP 8757 TaxID=2775288 RepID=UPI001785C242|nr:hypothetical protein [Aeromicrobium sp. CFBP 8757]MBD8605239.1 hypothetical protein [Aeromicrobium sp. CFBP 8757]
MRSEIRTALAVLATAAVLMGSATMALATDADPDEPDPTATATTPTASPTPSSAPTPTPSPTTEVPSTTRTITDAQLRWGVNDESNNRAFAPGTFNFLSAGRIPDPGRGGVIVPQSSWSQRSGDVSIEKFAAGSWRPATWAGLQTTSSGAVMSGTNGPFSNHEVVVSGGTGTVDPATGAASIRWTGSFTVVYYSGFSFFYVSDPRLTVVDGVGTLTGTLSGFGSSMEDTTTWRPVPDAPDAVLADLGPVDLTKDLGFTVQPAYAGVAVDVKDQTPQARTGGSWGSFPQSFVDFQLTAGTGSYWYSSGGSADAHKVAKPVTVSYSSGAPVVTRPPSSKGAKTSKVENDAPEAPSNDALAAPGLATTQPDPAAVVPAADGLPLAGTTTTQFQPASTVLGARSSTEGSGRAGLWVLGGVLLAGALLIAVSPYAYSAVRKD